MLEEQRTDSQEDREEIVWQKARRYYLLLQIGPIFVIGLTYVLAHYYAWAGQAPFADRPGLHVAAVVLAAMSAFFSFFWAEKMSFSAAHPRSPRESGPHHVKFQEVRYRLSTAGGIAVIALVDFLASGDWGVSTAIGIIAFLLIWLARPRRTEFEQLSSSG